MELPLRDRLEKTRTNLRHKLDEQADALKHRRAELQARGDELRHRAEVRVDAGRGRVLLAEARVLEAAADALATARETLGERAGFVEKGEKALRDALVELRAGHESTLPIAGYEALGVKQVLPALAGVSEAGLRTVRAWEVRHKNRVTVLREIDKRLS